MSWKCLLVLALVAVAFGRPQLSKSIEEDLERLENDLDGENEELDAEEEDEGTETDLVELLKKIGITTVEDLNAFLLEDLRGDLLLALDCGSSGTKALVYASDIADCPGSHEMYTDRPVIPCGTGGMKFVPTMSTNDLGTWIALLGEYSEEGTTRFTRSGMGIFVPRIKTIAAYATAGNRIIPSGTNQTAWNDLVDTVKSAYPAVTFSADGTIPGTKEAWMEFKSVNREFVSMGGASAQLGVVLNTPFKVRAWYYVMKRAEDIVNMACNNQNHIDHYYLTLDKRGADYTSKVARLQIHNKCKRGECIGLVSWLATTSLEGSNGGGFNCLTGFDPLEDAPTGLVHHWIGGIDQGKERFRDYQTYLQTKDGVDHPARCWGGAADAKTCAADLVRFSRRDATTSNIMRFMQGIHDVDDGSVFSPIILASLAGSVGAYNGVGDVETMTARLRVGSDRVRADPACGAWYGLFGVGGILVASYIIPVDQGGHFQAFTASALLDTSDISWISVQAAADGFPVPCNSFYFQENAADDGCTVNLALDEDR